MKRIALMVALSLVLFTGYAMAQSSGDRIGDLPGELMLLLENRLVKGSSLEGRDSWHEVYCSKSDSKKIFELAKGVGDPVDPSHVVGTWDIEERGSAGAVDDLVCCTYSPGEKYCFRIYEDPEGSGRYIYYAEDGTKKATAEILDYTGTCP